MGLNSVLIYATHGTYGRDDDAYGTMLAANAALAKGMDVTLVLVDDGVAMATKGQDVEAGGGGGVVGREGHDHRGYHGRGRGHAHGRTCEAHRGTQCDTDFLKTQEETKWRKK